MGELGEFRELNSALFQVPVELEFANLRVGLEHREDVALYLIGPVRSKGRETSVSHDDFAGGGVCDRMCAKRQESFVNFGRLKLGRATQVDLADIAAAVRSCGAEEFDERVFREWASADQWKCFEQHRAKWGL